MYEYSCYFTGGRTHKNNLFFLSLSINEECEKWFEIYKKTNRRKVEEIIDLAIKLTFKFYIKETLFNS